MPSFLQDVLSRTRPTTKAGKIHNITWQWLGEGVVSITPATYDKSVVISAGIHGNETAPIEMLEQIYQDIFAGELTVNSRLLLILGNPEAIRQNKRFIGFDMNRLFYQSYQPNNPPHCQNSCHPHPNNINGEKGDNHGTIQCRTQTSYTEQTFIT